MMMRTVIGQHQTVTLDGSRDLILSGDDTAFINLPYPYPHGTLAVAAYGDDHVILSEPGGAAGYSVNFTTANGTLTLDADMHAGAHVVVNGPGLLHMTATIGGGAGASDAQIRTDDPGSTITVLAGGTLGYSSLTFLQEADVTLQDGGTPAPSVHPVPALTIAAVGDIATASYSAETGLLLTMACGGVEAVPLLHIADPDMYALTQTAAGAVTIAASATGIGPYTYAPPPTPMGGEVFHL